MTTPSGKCPKCGKEAELFYYASNGWMCIECGEYPKKSTVPPPQEGAEGTAAKYLSSFDWLKLNRASLISTKPWGEDQNLFYVELIRKCGEWTTGDYADPEAAIRAARWEIDKLDGVIREPLG